MKNPYLYPSDFSFLPHFKPPGWYSFYSLSSLPLSFQPSSSKGFFQLQCYIYQRFGGHTGNNFACIWKHHALYILFATSRIGGLVRALFGVLVPCCCCRFWYLDCSHLHCKHKCAQPIRSIKYSCNYFKEVSLLICKILETYSLIS